MPDLTRSGIVSGLRALGLAPGNHVLVHSALSALGRVEGGAETVIDALLYFTLTSIRTDVPAATVRRCPLPSYRSNPGPGRTFAVIGLSVGLCTST